MLLRAKIFIVLILLFCSSAFAADRISIATGNFTTAGTWATVDTTSKNISESANTALTTSYVSSSNFTPGIITISGIAVKIATTASSPTGTISVELYNASLSASVAGTEVTLNVSDLPSVATTTNPDGGWVMFKFSAPVVLLAATNYNVRAKTSSSSQVNLYSSATTNWARMLPTTTTGAPGAGDDLHIMGAHTGAGAITSYTVTMDNTATTDFGSNTTSQVTPAMSISKAGTLQYGTTASTTFRMRLSGYLNVYSGGTLSIGTTGTPIPASSVGLLEFDNSADAGFGLEVRRNGRFNAQGSPRTAGKLFVFTRLSADEAAAQTVLSVNNDTGWLSGDRVIIASSSRTSTQYEDRTLNGNAGASDITVNSGLTNAHDGDAGYQTEIILLTRNVRLSAVTTTSVWFMHISGNAVVDADWAAFEYMGDTGGDERGIEVDLAVGANLDFNYCSFFDFEDYGFAVDAGTGAGTLDIVDSVFYNTANATGGAISFVAASTAVVTLDGCVLIRNGTSSLATVDFNSTNPTVNVTDNIMSSNPGDGMIINSGTALMTGTISGNELHSNASDGMEITGNGSLRGYTISNTTVWMNNAAGILVNGAVLDLTFDTVLAVGNTTRNFYAANAASRVTVNNLTAAGHSAFSTTYGIETSNSGNPQWFFNNADLGTATGQRVAHATADVRISTMTAAQIFFTDTLFATSTEVSNLTTALSYPGFLSSMNHDRVDGDNKFLTFYGNGVIDTSIYDVSPSLKLTPNSTTKLRSGFKSYYPSLFSVTVADNESATVSVKVRESVVGDGTDYNGERARLIMLANSALGLDADAVLDTATGSSEGAWETLSGTTSAVNNDGVLYFYVDCGGTGYSTGWVNVDTWDADLVNDSKSVKYWGNGFPSSSSDNVSEGGGGAATVAYIST